MRAVECAVRTIFFRCHRMRSRPPSLACACREHRGKLQRRTILLGAHGAPAGGAVLRVAAFLHADFATTGVARLLLPVGDVGWQGTAGRWAGYGWWYLRANPLRMVRRRFSTGSLPRRLTPFSLETSTPVGEGGHPHRAGSGPICRVKPTADNSLEKWGGGLYNDPFPPCFVSAPPLCRKASLST